jgi:hypothetical protein
VSILIEQKVSLSAAPLLARDLSLLAFLSMEFLAEPMDSGLNPLRVNWKTIAKTGFIESAYNYFITSNMRSKHLLQSPDEI